MKTFALKRGLLWTKQWSPEHTESTEWDGERAEWAAKTLEQNIRIKPEGEGWFSCAPAPESLLHQTFAPTEVLPLRPITLQVPPERTVLLSLALQCKFYVGFSEFGVGVWHAGVGGGTSRFICSDIFNKDIHFRSTTPETFSSAV